MSAKTKIAIVAASAPPLSAGGVASAHFNLFSALLQRGYDAQLFTFYDNAVGAGETSQGIHRFGASQKLINLFTWAFTTVTKWLAGGKDAHETAVILRSLPGVYRMTQAIQRFDPAVVLLSDHGAPGLFLKAKPGRRIVWVSHHNPMRFVEKPLHPKASYRDARAAIWFENRALRNVQAVICPSHYMRAWFERSYQFAGQVFVVPNMIDPALNQRSPASVLPGLAANARWVYLPSAGSRLKGADFLPQLLRALESVPDLHFYIPGHVEAPVQAQLAQCPAGLRDRMYMPGQLAYPEHMAVVKRCAFGISPALMENLSMAILEAAYHGVPMIVFDAGGNADIIQHGENGFLVPAYDLADMLAAAQKLARQPDLRALQDQTRAFTQRKFDADSILNQYLAIMGLAPSSQA